ncbi:MAG: HIT family protein [Candidatus Micrarchaeota archaeon]|nr:HIT family protein [Candidatus Micrarchaeota archaeon]
MEGTIAQRKVRGRKDIFCDPSTMAEHGGHNGEVFSVVFNKMPFAPGHSLIATVRHTNGLLDLTPHEAAELLSTLRKVLPYVLNKYNGGDPAYDIKIRSGDASGWTISHFHVHVIPRHRAANSGPHPYELIYEPWLDTPDRPVVAGDLRTHTKGLRRGAELNGDGKHALNGFADRRPAPIPSFLYPNVFFESQHFIALHHPEAVLPGQTLLVPKSGVRDFLALNDAELADLMLAYPKVMKRLLREYSEGSRAYITSFQTGGYSHAPLEAFHINLIPRKEGDRYAENHDQMYADIYERNGRHVDMLGREEIRRAVSELRRPE